MIIACGLFCFRGQYDSVHFLITFAVESIFYTDVVVLKLIKHVWIYFWLNGSLLWLGKDQRLTALFHNLHNDSCFYSAGQAHN